MSYVLKPHQVIGRDTLAAHPRFLLADEQRVGKTSQALTAAVQLGASSIQVVCKAIAVSNWRREIERWCPGSLTEVVDSYDRFVVNARLRRGTRMLSPDVAIVDECQMLRNAETKRAQFFYGGGFRNTGLLRDIPYVWLLSGTPSPNNAGELWTHLHALWYDDLRALMGRKCHYMPFIDRYTVWSMGDYGPRFYGNRQENIGELRQLLRRISLRRLLKDVQGEGEEPLWTTVVVDAKDLMGKIHKLERDPRVRRVLRDLVQRDEMPLDFEASDEGSESEEPLAALRRLTGLAKVPAAVEYVLDLNEQGKRVLVGAWHRDVLDALEAGLKKHGTVFRIDGKTSKTQRLQQMDRWQRGEGTNFLGQLLACGTSVDLSAADIIVLVESSWAPDDNWQFVYRALNITKSERVLVDVLALANSSDEGVQRVVTRKGVMSTELWSQEQAA